MSAILSLVACGSAFATGYRVRPFWGNEAVWNAWEFESDYVPKRDWKIVSVSREAAENWKAQNLIDDNPETFYYPNGQDSYEVAVDLGKSYELGAFTVLTLGRPNNAHDSRMASYEFFVSDSPENKGQAVAKGPFEGEMGKETVATFPAAKGRYVTLKAFARPNANKEVCLRELCLVEAEAVKRHLAEKEAAAAEKQARWKNRESDPAVEALAKEFLDLVFITQDEINRSNLRSRPKLLEIGKLRAEGKYAEALKVFRDYYFDKLRHPQAFGLPANDVHPYGRGFAGVADFPAGVFANHEDTEGLKKQIPAADALMKGLLTLGNGKTVAIGEPGAVDWNAPGAPFGYATPSREVQPYRELWWGTGFTPLFTAFMATRNEAYLKRWLAYMDDWSLNATFLMELHPIFNHDNSRYPDVTTIRLLAGIANALPYDSATVSPRVFAQIMKRLVTESPLNDIVYMRSNPNAWTPGAGRMLFAMMIDEFKAAPLYFRETRRRNIEDINVVQGLRDGTEDHQWPGYNFLLLINAGALRLMDARELAPPWAQPAWEKELRTLAWQRELRDHLLRRASYMIHWATPQGEYPLVTHHEPPTIRQKVQEALRLVPEAADEPTNARLVATLFGDGLNGTPDYTAEWFPYGGYSIARSGWTRDDGCGAMFCSPQPGCGSVGSACKNNAFGLAAYGMDLLFDDLIHSYVRPTSPIHVDKKRQCFDFNVHTAGWPSVHKGQMTVAWTEPSPWRWHASDRFNLMEGVYAGVYANNNRDRKDYVDDVAHQRLALFARKSGLWIVTDRMLTARKHDYEQLWWLPLKKKKEFGGFGPDEVVVDADARTIKTRRTRTDKWWSWDAMAHITVGNVNLSMHQFTDAALKYELKPQKADSEMYDFHRVGVSWQGEGNQQIVTALFPRKPTPEKPQPLGTENDLKSIQTIEAGKGANGFVAETPDGYRVTYLAAISQSGVLEADGIKATAEALLLTRDPKGQTDGVSLGCKEMAVGGKPVPIAHPDFEFSLPASGDASKLTTVPVYRPISPVKIYPEADVFVGEAEVSLKSETPNVVLRYTLDGTEPTPQSTLYERPFQVDRSVVVKARAYRPGVERNPPHTSGTHATAVSHALFTRRIAAEPSAARPRFQGLNFEYFESFWKDMWLSLDKLPPKKKGVVDGLFDLSPIPDDNRPVSDKRAPREKPYAFRYTGYLKVPEDGVYTIHAPREYVYCDTVAGYELQVYLGHAAYLDDNQVRREGDLSYWYPATRLHGLGTWSVPLKKGFHEFKVVYLDFRMDGPKRLNRGGGIRDYVWGGERPTLSISGPGIEKQPIPASWLWR